MQLRVEITFFGFIIKWIHKTIKWEPAELKTTLNYLIDYKIARQNIIRRSPPPSKILEQKVESNQQYDSPSHQ